MALTLDAISSVIPCPMPAIAGFDDAVALDVRPIKITLKAEHHISLLDLGAHGAAEHPATDIEAGTVEPVGDERQRILRAPAITAVHTDIKAGPVIDLGHHGRALIGLHRKVCRKGAGRTDGGKCCSNDKFLHVIHHENSAPKWPRGRRRPAAKPAFALAIKGQYAATTGPPNL